MTTCTTMQSPLGELLLVGGESPEWLDNVPYGTTTTYGALARLLGVERKVRLLTPEGALQPMLG